MLVTMHVVYYWWTHGTSCLAWSEAYCWFALLYNH